MFGSILSGLGKVASAVKPFAGDIIKAGGSIAGGLLGKTDQDVDWSGTKEGISWKVRDAKRAGIHPLYAIGAPTVGGVITSDQNPMGRAIESAAGDIGSGVSRHMDPVRRQQVKTAAMQGFNDYAQGMYNLSRMTKTLQEIRGARAETMKKIGGVKIGRPEIVSPVPEIDPETLVPGGTRYIGPFGAELVTSRPRTKVDVLESEPYGDASGIWGLLNMFEDATRSPNVKPSRYFTGGGY